jgi:hypothetical protein
VLLPSAIDFGDACSTISTYEYQANISFAGIPHFFPERRYNVLFKYKNICQLARHGMSIRTPIRDYFGKGFASLCYNYTFL